MGQIANQMVIEWCCKIVQKIKDKKQGKKDRKQIPEKTDGIQALYLLPGRRKGETNSWKMFLNRWKRI